MFFLRLWDENNGVYSVFTHQVLQCVAHQFLLQSFYQSHLNRLSLILGLTVGAEPLRQDRAILRGGHLYLII